MNTRCAVLFLLCACNIPSDPKTPEYWAYRLDDPKEQEEAVRKLGELKDPKGVDPLLDVMQKNEKLRPLAAQSLGMIADPRAVPALLAAITPDPGTGADAAAKNKTTERAITALGEMKAKEAADVLLEVHKKNRDLSVRMAAIRAMGAIRDQRFSPAFIDILDNDDNMYAKKIAAEAIGDLRDASAVPSLIHAMYVERGANIYPQASFALFQIGEPAIPALMETLAGKNERVNKLAAEKQFLKGAVAIKAIEVLGDLRAKQAEPLMLEAWNQEVLGVQQLARRSIAGALALMDTPKGKAHLEKALEEPVPELRQFYADALNEMSDRGSLKPLLAASMKGTDEAKHFAFIAYTRLADARDDKGAAAAVKATTLLEPEMVRIAAAKECGENFDCWVGKLKDKDGKVRDRAAYALGRLGNKKAAEPLAAAVKDSDLDARYASIWALTKIGTKSVLPALKSIETTEKGKLQTIRVNEYLKRLIVILERAA